MSYQLAPNVLYTPETDTYTFQPEFDDLKPSELHVNLHSFIRATQDAVAAAEEAARQVRMYKAYRP